MVEGAAAEEALKLYAYEQKRMRGEEVTLKHAGTKRSTASDYGDRIRREFGFDVDDIETELPDWFLEAAYDGLAETFEADFWTQINETTADQIQGFLERGAEDGLSTREIADLIEGISDEYSQTRAMAVARTEMNNAMNSGHAMGIDQIGEETGVAMTKVWTSILGPTTRPDHADADGQEVASDDEFVVGGEEARWPGDVNLSAEQRINCQCTVISGVADAELEESEEAGDEIEE